MKRAIFLFIIIVAVTIIGYWICIEVCSENNGNISIVFLQVNNPQEESKKLIDELVKIHNENKEETNIKFYFEPGIEKNFTFQPDDWSSEDEVTQMIKDSITSYLSQYKFNKLTNEQANVQIGSMIHLLTENDTEKKIFLFGSFPDCYKDKNVNKVIKDSKKNLSGLKENNNTVYWMIRTNDDEPEQKLLEVFKKYNIDVKNKQINVSKRKCEEHSSNYEIVILSKLNKNHINDFIDKINKLIKNDSLANIRITSLFGLQDNININYLEKTLRNSLNNDKNANTFLESRQLMIQIFNYCENYNDSIPLKVILVGLVKRPTKGERQRLKLKGGGLITNKKQKDILASKKNLEFYYYLLPHTSIFTFGKYFDKAFNKANIKVTKL